MERLSERQETLLEAVIREYVKTAEPVGSMYLASKIKPAVSAATVRNELAELEARGYLSQPHTSAGRTPTERAYRYFVEHLAHSAPTAKPDRELSEVFAGRERAIAAAKTLAAKTHECVFVSFGRDDVYVTGLGNLFAKPETAEHETARLLSAALDQLDEMVRGLEEGVGARLLIGEENPLSPNCATVYLAPTAGRRVGVLGLMRMDYEKVLGLLESIRF